MKWIPWFCWWNYLLLRIQQASWLELDNTQKGGWSHSPLAKEVIKPKIRSPCPLNDSSLLIPHQQCQFGDGYLSSKLRFPPPPQIYAASRFPLHCLLRSWPLVATAFKLCLAEHMPYAWKRTLRNSFSILLDIIDNTQALRDYTTKISNLNQLSHSLLLPKKHELTGAKEDRAKPPLRIRAFLVECGLPTHEIGMDVVKIFASKLLPHKNYSVKGFQNLCGF